MLGQIVSGRMAPLVQSQCLTRLTYIVLLEVRLSCGSPPPHPVRWGRHRRVCLGEALDPFLVWAGPPWEAVNPFRLLAGLPWEAVDPNRLVLLFPEDFRTETRRWFLSKVPVASLSSRSSCLLASGLLVSLSSLPSVEPFEHNLSSLIRPWEVFQGFFHLLVACSSLDSSTET